MGQIPVVHVDLCIYLFRIKQIGVVLLDSPEELVLHYLGRDVIWRFELELDQNILPPEVNYLPREVQLGDVEAILELPIVIRDNVQLQLGCVQVR